jgi:hypothetical protein
MVEVYIDPGICGLKSTVTIDAEDGATAVISFKTDCPSLKPMETELTEVDGYEECFSKIGDSGIYELAKKYCRHTACPVPSALIKGIECACGLALPKDVDIKITKL